MRSSAVAIIRRLREQGHVAYLAGGCVRDRLLGLEPKDHDVATGATPDVVQKLFRHSQPVGEAFGVVLVYERRVPIEVATFRTEGVYSDHRRPDAVQFTDAEHDAQRRDFTVNGLFESPGELRGRGAEGPRGQVESADAATRSLSDGSLILDHVGGLADLESQTLRAIGDPDRRFAEDYLRMLRAVRFTARLGFTLDPVTARAIRNLAKHLGQISRERIGGELRRMLTHPTRTAALSLLQSLRLDGPTLNGDPQDPDLPTIDALPTEVDLAPALAAWLLDRDANRNATPAQTVSRVRKALCLSNDETDTLGRIFRHLDTAAGWSDLSIARRKRLLAAADWGPTLTVLRAQRRASAIEADTPSLADDGIGLAPPALLTGRDLIALGLTPGPRFKTLLDDAYDRQLEGELTTAKQAQDWARRQP
jgi:tRNA nucleotidyltransferase/poly(A) polymerase